jgi:hypothetical protein
MNTARKKGEIIVAAREKVILFLMADSGMGSGDTGDTPGLGLWCLYGPVKSGFKAAIDR